MAKSNSKSVVFTFGRFSPPTIGHEKLIDTIKNLAKRKHAESRVYPSWSNDPKRNPLTHKDKVRFLRKFFRGIKIIDNPRVKTPFHAAKQISDEGFTDVTIVVGGDRVDDLRKLIGRYVNHPDAHLRMNFDKFEVVSAGDRDPDADDVTGMSASKMRGFAKVNDFDSFRKGVPKNGSDDDAKKMFDDIRKGMNIKEERDYKKEYADYHSKPDQIKNRGSRNKARREMVKLGRASKGDGKDIDHKDGNPTNNSPSNLRVMSIHKNRGRNNNKTKTPKSESWANFVSSMIEKCLGEE